MPEKVHTKLPETQDSAAASQNGHSQVNGQSYGKKRSAHEAFRDVETSKVSSGETRAPSKPTSRLKQRAAELQTSRKQLPIYAHRAEICERLRDDRSILLLGGETGSGKSTQVPQFLLNEPWCKARSVKLETGGRKKVGGCIAITQPRRVAAISLARRVAEEMGTPLGKSSPASQVGYSVRFDSNTGPATRIKFLTEGMLLQEMLRDPWLREYSAIVVDEVHERGVNVDLVLGFLRRLLGGGMEGRGGVGLRVVVMSATGNMKEVRNFFEGSDAENGANPDANGQVSEPEWFGFSDEDHPACTSTVQIQGRQYPVKLIYSPQPVSNIVDSALETIFHIHMHEALPGDILVFLTGQETVENLESLCHDYAASIDPKSGVPKLQILPLFAALPQTAQQKVFERTPPKTRKVIISTNIAETSVTVPGVRFVVDCGKHKRKQFSPKLGLDALLPKSISKSAANQRKGRAGREAPGTCYRLYTETTYLSFEPDNEPEILRCDLTQMVLSLKARGVPDTLNFPLLTRPKRSSLEKALLHLLHLRALDPSSGSITPLGTQIATLPVSPSLGCVLLTSTQPEHNCLDSCIDIIAALSVENVFLSTTSEEAKEAADAARTDLYRRDGDHLTLLATVQAYAAENADRKVWCESRFVSHRAMKAVMDVRRQLQEMLRQYRPKDPVPGSATTSEFDLHERILRAFLTGFTLNTALLVADGSYRTVVGRQAVSVHPSSVLFGRKIEAIMYNEFVYTNKAYARGVSAVQMGWIGV